MRYVVGVFFLVAFVGSGAQALENLTYQGRIIRPDGSPVNANPVMVTIQIRSPGSENCLLYQETHTLDMRNTDGVFSISIGGGTRASSSVDGGYPLSRIFANRPVALTSLPNCDFGSDYTPNSADSRKLNISFNDGSGVQTLQAQTMTAVPYAIETHQISGYGINSLLRVDGVSAPAFNSTEFGELQNLISGISGQYTKANELGGAALPALSTGESLRWNGSGWEAMTAGSVVNSVTAGTGLNVGAGPGGTITSSGTLNLSDTGVTAGTYGDVTNIPQLEVDAQGRLTSVTNVPLTTVANFSGSLGGDVSGTQGATTVDRIKGVAVSSAAPLSGQVLRHDGSQWVPTVPNVADLKNAAGDAQFPTDCSESETLTFDSVNDKFLCTAISVATFTGSLAGDVSGPANGTVVGAVGGMTAANVAAGATLANNATDANTASTIVRRDASGDFSAGTITATWFAGNLSGTATNTQQIQGNPVHTVAPSAAGQTLVWDGAKYVASHVPVQQIKNAAGVAQIPTTCSASETLTFDSPNDKFVCTPITVSSFSGTLAGDVTGSQAATVVSTVSGVTAANVAAGATLANNATSANTANTIVKRDASGNFAAGTVTATTFTGNLTGTATNTQQIQGKPVHTVAPSAVGQTLVWDGAKYVASHVPVQQIKNAAGVAQIPTTCSASQTLTFDSLNDKFVCSNITVSSFSGTLAGDVTGSQSSTVVSTVSGVTAANVAAGATLANNATSANTASTIVKRDASGNFAAGTVTATTFTGNLTGTATNTQQIQGNPVHTVAPSAAGQTLIWDGAKYVAKNPKFQDLKTAAALQQFPTNCSTTQVMIYSAVTDAYECQNITLVNTTSTMTGDVTGSVTSNTVTKIQNRDVASTAPGTNEVLKWNGSAWAPAPDVDAGGDITGVTAGTGLTGGGTAGAVSLAVSYGSAAGTSVQGNDARVGMGACGAGNKQRWTGSAWVCEPDADSGGDITGVTAGTGLTGGGTAGAVSLAVAYGTTAGTAVQGNDARANPTTCGAGNKQRWNGSAWVCETDATGAGLTACRVCQDPVQCTQSYYGISCNYAGAQICSSYSNGNVKYGTGLGYNTSGTVYIQCY